MTGRRVVMLVANGVRGDSRVQKTAESMAGRGWETVLIGRAPGDVREEFRLGGARVVLLPVRPVAAGRGPAGQVWWLLCDAVRGRLEGPSGRAYNPWFLDLERAFAPEVARLQPDLIHGHDHHMAGVAARIAARLSRGGRKPVRWVYDAHEYRAGTVRPRRWDARARLRRRVALGPERAFIRGADAVVTVSTGIATRLAAEHRLAPLPAVVRNAPVLPGEQSGGPDIRRAAGLPPHMPVLVYSGGLAPQRGVADAVEAMVRLPGAALVLVARESDPDLPGLLALARRIGVADRVRPVPYVEPSQVVPYIAAATAGLVPLHHRPNHELSLITKYLEYAAARLPIVCSDVREMARTTELLRIGEVHRAGDVPGLAAAARRVLLAPDRYRAAYRPGGPAGGLASGGWEREAEVLDGVYRRVLGLPVNSRKHAVYGETPVLPALGG